MDWMPVWIASGTVLLIFLAIILCTRRVYQKIECLHADFAETCGSFESLRSKIEEVEDLLLEVLEECKEIKSQTCETWHDTQILSDRLSALETEIIMYSAIPDENKRSEAAKKMWERRRSKELMRK